MLSTTFQSWRRSASPEGDPPHLTVSPVTGIAPQSHLPLIVPDLHRTRESSALSPEHHPLQPTSDVQHFIGYVETTTDALRLLVAARQGIIPRITRPLNDSERRSMIRSGAVFVFYVEESGIKRWTEGLSWSPSRIVGNFLVCRCFPLCDHDTVLFPPGTSTFRVAPPSSPANSYYHGRSDPSGARDSGAARSSNLIKKTITVKVSGTDHRLVSYYREDDVARGLLQRPTSRPDIMRLTIPPEMVHATNFRHPPHIEIRPDGNVPM
ncbi:Gti1/Pac2 family-domain-containing protein [Russula brevipes]|nr:Gti1/Pac2 family-domain-containing protein [Russula brevipes]